MLSMRRLPYLGRLVRKRKLAALLVTSGLVLGFLQLLGTSFGLHSNVQDSRSVIQDGFSWGHWGQLSIVRENKNWTMEAAVEVTKKDTAPEVVSPGRPEPPVKPPGAQQPRQQPAEPPGEAPEEGERTLFNAMPAVPGLGLTPALREALSSALVLGNPRSNGTRRFLTVGVPTVKREKATYLLETLDSLLAAIPQKEQDNVLLLVFVADLDADYNREVIGKLAGKYARQLDSGLMQVITNNRSMYPDLYPKRRTFNDSQERVFWRCKQNIDTAFLFSYAANLSTYYIHLEDDVITARSFIADVKKFVGIQRKPWVMLEFGRLGFIGKMFHSRDLAKLAACLIVFYQEQPVDLLVPYFIKIMTQAKRTYAPYSLFQHIGLHSSLKNKKQPLVDKRFKKTMNKRVNRAYKVVNPDAVVTSDMQPYEDSRPVDPYEGKGYVFWAADVIRGNYYKAVFSEPQNVSAVAVLTGAVFAPSDALYNATLRYGVKAKECEDSGANLPVAQAFQDGSVVWKPPQPLTLACVDVFVEQSQKFWVLFREVAVFTGNYTLPPPPPPPSTAKAAAVLAANSSSVATLIGKV